jgi:hypothetical protein
MLGILAVCFAPGATGPHDDARPREMAAAVLAPTVTDHAGSTPAAPRDVEEVALPLVAAVLGLVLALAQARRFAPALDDDARRVALPPRRRPPRRGPPLLAG